jgi:hypothetical protein
MKKGSLIDPLIILNYVVLFTYCDNYCSSSKQDAYHKSKAETIDALYKLIGGILTFPIPG